MARVNATIRKYVMFAFDFAPQNIQDDAVVAEQDQFASSCAPARGRKRGGLPKAHKVNLVKASHVSLLRAASGLHAN